MNLMGHFWTVYPLLKQAVRPLTLPRAAPWSCQVVDPDVGRVELTGLLQEEPASEVLVVLIHGIGGCATSRYNVNAAHSAQALGVSSLRLNLRGCDRRGQDLHHAGLTSDFATILTDPRFARYSRIYLLGYSLGGHLVLRFATEVEDPRVRAVAAISTPLDLERAVTFFDQPQCWLYRRYILSHLADIYTAVARRRKLAVPPEKVQRIRYLREWDENVIVPRFGFADTADYYRQTCVGPHLDRLRVPALLIATEKDPMIHPQAVRAALTPGLSQLEVYWTDRGGHVGFPPRIQLGEGPAKALDDQVLEWLVAK